MSCSLQQTECTSISGQDCRKLRSVNSTQPPRAIPTRLTRKLLYFQVRMCVVYINPNNLPSLHYSPLGFTEIKQVSTFSIQVCQGPMEINAWNTFILRVEHSYIMRKSEKSLDMGEPTFHVEKTACYRLQQQTKVHV